MDWREEQSNHNARFSRYLERDTPLYRDWEITALFYSALHIVESYLSKTAGEVKSHTARRDLIRDHLGDISNEYRKLKELSGKARYDCLHSELTKDEKELALEHHAKIVKFVEKKLKIFEDN